MPLRPCITCGEPAECSRCADHRLPDRKPTAQARGYDSSWDRLSRRARRLQPWCLDCGSTEDLQADHTPEAWRRKQQGKPIRLEDITVRCGPCNRAAGAARGNAVTRGDDPNGLPTDPPPEAKFPLHTPGGID